MAADGICGSRAVAGEVSRRGRGRALEKMKSEWRGRNRKETSGGDGGVAKAKLKQFTVAQRSKLAAFVRRDLPLSTVCFRKVCPRLLTLAVLAAAAVEAGPMARLAAEAIWLSSTSKVGQLVPVAPLMC